jgi:DNA adenine methylase
LTFTTPHIIQYQGSKRLLAPQILNFMPKNFSRLIEPFAGMAAITIAASRHRKAEQYIINDINAPVVSILEMAINHPADLVKKYHRVWSEQFKYSGGDLEHFYYVRESFNNGEKSPENMLYLLARCVKGSVRYGKSGNFNQSPDKRRHGASPQKLENHIYAVSSLLKGKTQFLSTDYREILSYAKSGDLVYMDPPYQGVSSSRDKRYYTGLDFHEFVDSITYLNNNGIDFLISYDGVSGNKEYGFQLPKHLNCSRVLLNAGLSTQSTLLGKSCITFESLYISENLTLMNELIPQQKPLF